MNKLYHDSTDLFNDIQKDNSSLIFLTGKTCTGKTTLARKFSTIGYQSIHIDDMVVESVQKKFNADEFTAFAVFKGNVAEEWKRSFLEATRIAIISKLKKGPVLVEGALANNEIIKELFNGDLSNFLFLFLLPVDLEAYANRITNRFVTGAETKTTGLPENFFDYVTENDMKNYVRERRIDDAILNKIRDFTKYSSEESQRRLDYFKESFEDIIVVETS